mmetsp:Transcript_55361/g.132067  ORF Transcript_55361/g.132067 Transcript_55361/m.132067 type:complete len:85 (-) Transcript_55361:53-307(-)
MLSSLVHIVPGPPRGGGLCHDEKVPGWPLHASQGCGGAPGGMDPMAGEVHGCQGGAATPHGATVVAVPCIMWEGGGQPPGVNPT